MKRNNIIFKLGALLVVLAAVAMIFANPFEKQQADPTGAVVREKGGSSASGQLLVDATAESISAVEITPPGKDSFSLSRAGDKWLAVQGDNRYKADSERVDRLLEALPGLLTESLVSERAESFHDLGVHEDNAIRVAVYAGGDSPVAELLVGNSAPGYSGTFVRRADGTEVYKSAANIRALVGFSYPDYRSKQPWDFDTQLVDKLTVRPVAGKPQVFTKQDGIWKTSSGSNANQNMITTLLNDWSKLKISEFADAVKPGETAYDPSAEGASPAGTGGVDSKGNELPAAFKLGLEPNLIAEGTGGRFSLTLGVKEGGLYFLADGDGRAYRAGEYDLRFFRELKHDELLIAPSEDAMVDPQMLGDGADSNGAENEESQEVGK